MGFLRTAAEWLGLTRSEGPSDAVTPPARVASGYVTPTQAMTLSAVFRAIQIHAVAASQLSLDVERGGEVLEETPSLVRRPDVERTRSAWIEETVTSLATTGNAFWRKTRSTYDGSIINLTPLNPHLVTVVRDAKTGQVQYLHDGKTLTAREIQHLQLMRVPGRCAGLGPIQAAQVELAGTMNVRDYAGNWFTPAGADIPSGVLKTDQALTGTQAKQYKEIWNETADGGVRVLGAGLSYTPIILKPEDAQWLEVQQFSDLRISRMFGVPASLMLVAVEGNSQTYSNVEQDWIAYVRFSLMAYLREIEEALTECLPRTQTVRFNIETLLRTDTKTRYEAHEIAIRAGLYTPQHAARIERIPADAVPASPPVPAAQGVTP